MQVIIEYSLENESEIDGFEDISLHTEDQCVMTCQKNNFDD